MQIYKVAAFSNNEIGGNPAGVTLVEHMPADQEMLKIASDIGFSETAFLKQQDDGWRIRYFAPEMEVPFCGHATIASGAVLGKCFGSGKYQLFTNDAVVPIIVEDSGDNFSVTLHSPPTYSEAVDEETSNLLLNLFNLNETDLNSKFSIQLAHAGANHIILPLNKRQALSDMSYDFETLKKFMLSKDLTTIDLVWIESDEIIHCRNPFPVGGIYEDPATGAAAAALAGYLRDNHWQGSNNLIVFQGEDMGSPSKLRVSFTNERGSSVKVSGETRFIE
ncbi:MAG: PhzF family phenazine biosynthesis protein [Gammaproteobacteria bacterium]|nr:PhzF family phenazine biosynthesis protein [Gammaproteobacteria bacterium]